MKKHIFGFALFSFIVGATVFIYAMLNLANVVEVSAPAYSPTYSHVNSCWRMKRESSRESFSSPIVKQAVFNLDTKQFKWELNTSNIDAPIALNFFIKIGDEMHYVSSKIVPKIAFRNGTVSATSCLEWMDNLESYKNIYVIAEPVWFGEHGHQNFSREFDASKATPVLIY